MTATKPAEAADIFKQLKSPFPVDLVSWRIGATNAKKNGGKATKGIALAYIDARDVMNRLDEVVGPSRWQAIHTHAGAKTSCKVGILLSIDDPGNPLADRLIEWVWKENGAGDTATAGDKGAFSDAFKRAAVLWGVGRYLYDMPNIWVDIDQWGEIDAKGMGKLNRALAAITKGEKPTIDPEDLEPVPPSTTLQDIPKTDQLQRTPVNPDKHVMTGDEFLILQSDIRDAKTLEELQATWTKINDVFKTAVPNPDQKNTLTKAKDDKKHELDDVPAFSTN